MPYTRPYTGGFKDYPDTTTPINSTALNTMDVGIKTANDQFQTVTTAQRTALTPTVGQAVWDSDLKQLMVYMNASGGNAWQPVGNRIVCASTTRPSTPFHGQMIYETDTKKEFVYNGSAWVQTNTASTTSGVTGVSSLIVPPSVMVSRTTNLSAYTSGTDITWSSPALYDTDGMNTSTTTLTIQTTGLYLLSLHLFLTATATLTGLGAFIYRNGSGFHYQFYSAVSTTAAYANATVVASLTAGDTLTARGDVFGGSAYVINGGSTLGNGVSRLSATWIGRTS